VASLVADYPDWFEELTACGFACSRTARLDRAGYLYVKGYLIAFGGAERAKEGATYQSTADRLVQGRQFALCMRRLNDRAVFYQYVLDLPTLSETCQRCVVSQCRRHADETRANYIAALSTTAPNGPEDLIAAYQLLAQQTIELAKLFCQHQKNEIADRSYQDAIVSASLAAHLDRERREHEQDLQRYYLAYVAFLYAQHRDEDALSVLDRMNAICRN
jgi:hypothetical protein